MSFDTLAEDTALLVENRDLLTAARLNIARANELGTTDRMSDYLIRLATAQATVAGATQAAIANRLKWIDLFPDTRLAQQFRTEIEEAL